LVLNLKNFDQALPAGDMEMDEPPPDLPSHLLVNRIVYLGLPLTHEAYELIFSQLLILQHDDSERPIYLYINSTGVVKVCTGFEEFCN
jgi:ATP-dependent Clp protease, protease subunit